MEAMKETKFGTKVA